MDIYISRSFKNRTTEHYHDSQVMARLRNHNATNDGNVDFKSFQNILHLKPV